MVDDIRPREAKLPVEKNKQLIIDPPEALDDQEPAFVPPELAEETEPSVFKQEDGFATLGKKSEESKPKDAIEHKTIFHKLHFHFKQASRKHQIIGGIIGVVLLFAGGGGVFALSKHFSKAPIAPATTVKPIAKKVEPPKPTTEASRLTGVQISLELNKRPVTSIQIENSPDARPQSGLKDAGVVYEAIAEGGITRFNASFLEAQPDYIGPVRSVRPYYAVLAAPFDPIFVHAGGSGEGLAKLRDLGLKDLDHGANGGAFKRVNDRYAPHNLYTSTADLDKASAGRGYTSSDVKGFARKSEKPGQPVTARVIDIFMSSALYNVHYDYDPASNTYKRSEGGKPHVDHRSKEQLAPKVVVTLAMSYSQNGIYSVYQTTGEGAMTVFQDGQVQTGTWKKASEKAQFEFFGADGKPLTLNAGQTWFTLTKGAGDTKYTL